MKYCNIPLMVLAAFTLAACGTTDSGNLSSATAVSSARTASAEAEIASLFDRWNQSLQTGDPSQVVANYAEESILLPTVSNKPRLTAEEKEDYFLHFLEKKPSGVITMRQIQVDSDLAVDSGLYTFTFATTGEQVRARYSFTYRYIKGEWLIISHHSSGMPE
ncbi:MAG: SgcJ/EcaC family oxidoreductase [Verrucomicrobiales bacterium]